jgi:hypothetical protein
MATHNAGTPAGGSLRIIGISCLLVWLLGFGPPLVADANLPRVEPGIEYLHHRIGDGPWSIHVVKVDRSGGRFGLVSTLARGHIYGLAGVHEQVESLDATCGRPVAAINGDFFVIRPGPYQGDPTGLHIVQGELVSAPTGASFWVDEAGNPHLGAVTARFRATGPDGLDLAFSLNEDRADDEAVLYTPALGASTRTGPGLELVLEKAGDGDWLPLRPGRRYQARIAAHHRQGDTRLTPQVMVLSIGPALAQKLRAPAPGAVISLDVQTIPDLTGVTTALGGGPVLLDAGQAPDWRPPQPRHPRTVLGWNNEHFFLMVVDGRQKSLSAGMTYPELAALMSRLGCTYAINLDGGGSSTLWLDGHIMNSPSDGRERRVANGLVVVSKEQNRNETQAGY